MGLEGTEREARAARERVRDLGNEMARTAAPSKALAASYRDAVSELRRLERAEGVAQTRLAARRRELQAAGLDTHNLANEQRRLSQEMQKALSAGQADQQLQSAQKSLGVGEIERTQRELVKLRGEYQLVAADSKQALSAGDVAGAQRQAQAALKMLQELAAAGGNTYGFEGFIKELQAIELAANDIEQTNAEAKLQAIRAEIASLEEQAKQLKDISVSVKTDESTIEQVRSQIQALAQQLGQTEIVMPVRLQMPDTSGAATTSPTTPGFSGGGWTGPGGKYQPAGIVHAGEHVQPQEVVREPGALAFLERIRRNGFRATLDQLRLRGSANGGPVVPVPRFVPNVPAPSPALLEAAAGPQFPHLGQVDLSLAGASYTMYVEREVASELRLAARQFGRTHR